MYNTQIILEEVPLKLFLTHYMFFNTLPRYLPITSIGF